MRWWSAVLAAALIGCGAESPSSSKGPATPPAPVVLTSLAITPDDSTIGLNDVAALTVVGTWSNGAVGAVSADWTVDDPSVATVTSATGTATTVLGLAEGACTVTASASASASNLLATATVTVAWTIPADPGPVYASASGRITRYAMGSDAPATVATGSFGNGFVLNAAGDALYTLVNSGGAQAIHRIDPATGAATALATLPSASYLYFCLDYDAQGRLYTINGDGTIVRVDPSTGAVESPGTGNGFQNSMAVGPDGRVYTSPLYQQSTYGWISRVDLSTGARRRFADIPEEVLGSYGMFINCGLVVDRKGRVTIGDFSGDSMWRFQDLNGDGDALDAGEGSRLATLPTGYGAYSPSPMQFGTALAGGGSILVNCDGTATSASAGIYWLTDRNGDGDCDDAGEVTLFNPNRVNNQLFGTCLQAKR